MKEWAKAVAKLVWLGIVLLWVAGVAVAMFVQVIPAEVQSVSRPPGAPPLTAVVGVGLLIAPASAAACHAVWLVLREMWWHVRDDWPE